MSVPKPNVIIIIVAIVTEVINATVSQTVTQFIIVRNYDNQGQILSF